MEIKKGSLNKGETFCVSVKSVKEVFKSTNILLNFAWTSRYAGAFLESPLAYYMKRNIKGKIIAAMHMSARQERPVLSFYIMRDNAEIEWIKRDFELNYLNKFRELYDELVHYSLIDLPSYYMCVEFIDGKLKLHKTKI